MKKSSVTKTVPFLIIIFPVTYKSINRIVFLKRVSIGLFLMLFFHTVLSLESDDDPEVLGYLTVSVEAWDVLQQLVTR